MHRHTLPSVLVGSMWVWMCFGWLIRACTYSWSTRTRRMRRNRMTIGAKVQVEFISPFVDIFFCFPLVFFPSHFDFIRGLFSFFIFRTRSTTLCSFSFYVLVLIFSFFISAFILFSLGEGAWYDQIYTCIVWSRECSVCMCSCCCCSVLNSRYFMSVQFFLFIVLYFYCSSL